MLNIKRLEASSRDFWSQLEALLAWENVSDEAVTTTVREIIEAVKRRGDALTPYPAPAVFTPVLPRRVAVRFDKAEVFGVAHRDRGKPVLAEYDLVSWQLIVVGRGMIGIADMGWGRVELEFRLHRRAR